jgi:hypothetical protein
VPFGSPRAKPPVAFVRLWPKPVSTNAPASGVPFESTTTPVTGQENPLAPVPMTWRHPPSSPITASPESMATES